jgi:type II secretory pathway component PulJ
MEVLVAMSLLALLMAALSGSIGFVGRSWDAGWRASEQSAALSRVEKTIRQAIAQSFPATIRADKKDRFLFEGSADRLRLVASESRGLSASGLYVAEFSVTTLAGQRQLLYRRYPFTGTAANAGTLDQAQLVAENFEFKFSYFGSPRPKSPPTWLDSWTSDTKLPELVRVDVRGGSTGPWSPIIIRPLITAEYSCIRASEGGLCRLQVGQQ